MAGVGGDRSPFRIASLCVKADNGLCREHLHLMRCRKYERRLRLETSFLKYRLALLRKRRGVTGTEDILAARSKLKGNNHPSGEHIEYIVADSDSEEDADVHTVLTNSQRKAIGSTKDMEATMSSFVKTNSVPKRPTNGYLCFCSQMRPLIMHIRKLPLKQQEMQRVISQAWKEMPINMKKHYFDMYEKDKKRYAKQKQIYAAKGDTEVEEFVMPSYLLGIPRFVPRIINEALLRDEGTGEMILQADRIVEISKNLSADDLKSLTVDELPPGILADE